MKIQIIKFRTHYEALRVNGDGTFNSHGRHYSLRGLYNLIHHIAKDSSLDQIDIDERTRRELLEYSLSRERNREEWYGKTQARR
jgi:hypothetical protein